MAVDSHGAERLESPQVDTRKVLLSALAFLLLLGGSIGLVNVVYYRAVPVQSFPAPETFPQPRVQTGQRAQLARLVSAQKKRLNSYGWVDRRNGLIQIPVKRAMQMLVAKGAQAYAPLAPGQALSSPSAGAERLMTPQAGSPPGGSQEPSDANTQPKPPAAITPAKPPGSEP